MPLDAAVQAPAPDIQIPPFDELTAIGVTPLDPDFVRRYKIDYHNSHQGGGSASWLAINLRDYDLRYDLRGGALQRARRYYRGSNTVPRALRRLALTVSKQVTQPEFEIEYFYVDPILNVTYGPKYNRRKACLGIWDKGRVTHIATGSVSWWWHPFG
jgi:hypothetical protein